MPFVVSRSGLKEHELAMFRRLDRMGPEAMLGALDRVGHETLQVWRGAIQSGVSASGRVFSGLSPQYARRKQKEVGDRPILVRTGDLLRSLAYRIGEKRKFVYELVLGASGPKAYTVLMQMTGTRKGRGGAPARDFTRMPRVWWRTRLVAGLPELPQSGT